jgi:hypothetical protein
MSRLKTVRTKLFRKNGSRCRAPDSSSLWEGRGFEFLPRKKQFPRSVGLIAGVVLFGQHAVVEDAGNQNAGTVLTVKYDMLAMLHTAQARANFVAGSAERGIVSQSLAKNFEVAEMAGGLGFAPCAKCVLGDAEQVGLRAARKTEYSHS